MPAKLLCLAVCPLLLSSALINSSSAVEKRFTLNLSAAKYNHRNLPLKVIVALPKSLADAKTAAIVTDQGRVITGQLTELGLTSKPLKTVPGQIQRELHFILPKLEAGQSMEIEAVIPSSPTKPQASFAWHDTPGKHNELRFAGRAVLRYMYEALDSSSDQRRMETYKPYHHVFDPQGKRLMTKGPGGLYPHHRGLYFGFNKISYGNGKTADVWHCRAGESQSHEAFLAAESGPILGRHRMEIHWRGKDGKIFAAEQREMSAYHTPGGLLIEFASQLKSTVGKLTLKGDPQHAGFQFRASQDVPDKTKKQTYYLRLDGRDKPGSFRNWPQNKQHVNLPWNAMSIVLDNQRYTVCYLDRPENPKEARFSERDYGRFGSYFEYELTGDQTLDLNYRIWLQEGEMTVEGVDAHSKNFTNPPQITLQ